MPQRPPGRRLARSIAVPALLAGLTVLGGCGGASAPGSASGGFQIDAQAGRGDFFDPRTKAARCIRQGGVPAHKTARHEVQIGDGPPQPTILFTSSMGDALTRSLRGRADAAEQIGDALLYVNGGSDRVLSVVEKCLDDLEQP